MATSKCPPKFEDESNYENWKRDISIWCELTDLAEDKRALAIHLTLTGRARIATSEIELEDLKSENGVGCLIEKLDSLFLPDKGRRQFAAFHNMYNFRKENRNVHEYGSEFEHKYYKFTQEGMTLPDSVMAFMLLASCSLPERETQIVMSAIPEINYTNMKSTLKRVFGQQVGVQCPRESNVNIGVECPSVVKTEPVFCGNSKEIYYANRGQRLRKSAGRYSYRGRGRGESMSNSAGFGNRGSNRRLNPLGRDGQVSRCVICDSCYHWARYCPHSYENNEISRARQCEPGGGSGEEHMIQMSLFVGYTSEESSKQTKVERLVEESRNCGILDTGCSTTVCGQQWLGDYLNSLCDEELAMVKEEKASATFTFGDGVTHKSTKRVVLPCWIGGLRSELTTDFVECCLPLLISKESMKKGKSDA